MTMQISLSDELVRLVESRVATGRYASASDVVREALGLMEAIERQDADRLQSLRTAWTDGIDGGDAGEIDFAALKAEARERRATPKV